MCRSRINRHTWCCHMYCCCHDGCNVNEGRGKWEGLLLLVATGFNGAPKLGLSVGGLQPAPYPRGRFWVLSRGGKESHLRYDGWWERGRRGRRGWVPRSIICTPGPWIVAVRLLSRSGVAKLDSSRLKHRLGGGVFDAGVEYSPPSQSGRAGVPYWLGNWVRRWDMAVLWANDPRIIVPP